MLPLEIPEGTTIEALVTQVIPDVHAKLVSADAPADPLVVALTIEGRGSWTLRIRGPSMSVAEDEEGAARRATLWVYATEQSAERFLEDAAGPRRLLPRFPPVGGVATMSDPRVVKRVAMASGRLELAAIDEDGTRMAIVFGFGAATRRGMDPDDADVTVEARFATIERVLRGELAPEDALADGEVTVRGNRLLAMQLALAVAPFYPARR
jgi:putative sterol carrier protein